jgi:nucleotide-binding universal stress UspA family protein
MSYGSILVPIDDHPAAAGSIAAALQLAVAFGARVQGVAIVPPLKVAQRLRPRQSAAALMKKEWEHDKQEARAGIKRFEAQAKKAGVAFAEGLCVEGDFVSLMARHARTADLVVLPLPGEDDIGVLGGHAVEAALLAVGRPMLLVPQKGLPSGFPRKVLVAWNGSREAARALTDALPLLSRAKSVHIFTAGPANDEGPIHGAKAAIGYLASHQVQAEAMHATAADDRVGDAILARAGRLGADLVVMGAYGRPRFAELILGGATRAILRRAAVPVLMSH